MQDTPELMTTSTVARLLGVSPRRVLQLARDRADFPAAAVESQTARGVGTRRWRRADIERWDATADRSPGRRWPR